LILLAAEWTIRSFSVQQKNYLEKRDSGALHPMAYSRKSEYAARLGSVGEINRFFIIARHRN